MTLSAALLCGILYFLSEANIPYLTVWTIQKPLVCGWITGCILGCPKEGALCGAVISLLYIGYRSHGTSMPSDIALGGICAAAAAAAGAPLGSCAVFALPAGFFGILVWQFRLHCNAFFMKKTEEAIKAGRFWSILRPSVLAPSLFSAAVCVPVGAVFSYGAYRAAQWISRSAAVPKSFLNGLEAAGLLLCVIGLLYSLFPLRQKRTVLSFLSGMFLVLITKLPLILVAIPAAPICAILTSLLGKRRPDTAAPDIDPDLDPDFDPDVDPDFDPDFDPGFDPDADSGHKKKKASLPAAFSSSSSVLSLVASNLLWILFVQAAYNTKLMMGQAAAAAFLPVLKVIHPDDPAKQQEVLQRQCVYLNTQPEIGSCLIGRLIALEAQQPAADPERIRSVRSALMGVFGALGDELFQCGFIPLLLMVIVDLVLRGCSGGVCAVLYGLAAALSAAALSALSFWSGLAGDEMRLLGLLESPFFHRIRHTMDLLIPLLTGAAMGSFLLFILLPALGL